MAKSISNKDKKIADEVKEDPTFVDPVAEDSQINEKKLKVYHEEDLKKMTQVGMRRVDPTDIRPARMLLMQSGSSFEDFVSQGGDRPKEGEYFHTGKRSIWSKFVCNFLYAAKSQYLDESKGEERSRYWALGCLSDFSIFGMDFKSSSLYTLSPLFEAVKGQGFPMFSFQVRMESKRIVGSKHSWFIPVCRVEKRVQDDDRLGRLAALALKWDKRDVKSGGEDVKSGEEEIEAEDIKPDDVTS